MTACQQPDIITGTVDGWRAHLAAGERACLYCARAAVEAREHYDPICREKGGTSAGVRLHRERRQRIDPSHGNCEPCRIYARTIKRADQRRERSDPERHLKRKIRRHREKSRARDRKHAARHAADRVAGRYWLPAHPPTRPLDERIEHGCACCGTRDIDALEIDHIWPLARNGHPDDERNLQWLCRNCNCHGKTQGTKCMIHDRYLGPQPAPRSLIAVDADGQPWCERNTWLQISRDEPVAA